MYKYVIILKGIPWKLTCDSRNILRDFSFVLILNYSVENAINCTDIKRVYIAMEFSYICQIFEQIFI